MSDGASDGIWVVLLIITFASVSTCSSMNTLVKVKEKEIEVQQKLLDETMKILIERKESNE